MIHQLNIYGEDKVQIAVKRLKAFEPPEGYYLCFSGGKDSNVIKALADMAGVKYDAHYNNTGIDPPEAVRFIKRHHPDVKFETPKDADGNRITMWSLIPKSELETYPRYKALYLKAFEEMLKTRQEKGLKTEWQTADDVMEWWLHGSDKNEGSQIKLEVEK